MIYQTLSESSDGQMSKNVYKKKLNRRRNLMDKLCSIQSMFLSYR